MNKTLQSDRYGNQSRFSSNYSFFPIEDPPSNWGTNTCTVKCTGGSVCVNISSRYIRCGLVVYAIDNYALRL